MNGGNTKAIKPPTSANDIYKLAGSWVKMGTRTDGGIASSFVTIEEEARAKNKKKNGRLKKGGGKEKPEEQEKKQPRDLSHIE